MNVMFATKDFRNPTSWLFIKEHTLERNLMNVMFATKDFRSQAIYGFIREHTLEKNLDCCKKRFSESRHKIPSFATKLKLSNQKRNKI